MRVLHLNTTDTSGGAARGAYWLHRALRDVGVDSLMMVDKKYSTDSSVFEVSAGIKRVGRRVRARLDNLPLHYYGVPDESYWSVAWVPHPMEGLVRALHPDVIHLHWITGGFIPISGLQRLGGPLVWSLRDMWAFTGGCHYSGHCNRFTEACGSCPQLDSLDENDLSRSIYTNKREHWHDLDLWAVPISTWLADQARASSILGHFPMEVIPNGVDIERFRPLDPVRAKKHFGFAPDRPVVAFGAVNATTDHRKGFSKYCEAVKRLFQMGWRDRVEFVVFGDTVPESERDEDLPMRFIGRVNDDRELATLYSAADVTVVPSLQEAFGKTVIESFACATPVVAFRTGGPADIVDHKRNGYLAKPFDAKSLADGIAWCAADPIRLRDLGREAREKVVLEYDILAVARRYHDLYRRILRRNHEQT